MRIHAAVGIDAVKTVCGIPRSTRRISDVEKAQLTICSRPPCKRCTVGLEKRYGLKNALHVEFVYVERS